jgi:hypothetical protein
MNIEKLVRKAVKELNNRVELPKFGFIAGGSIANLVWQYVSNNKAVINDVDIFIDTDKKNTVLFKYEKKQVTYDENYVFAKTKLVTKVEYEIYEVEREELLNLIFVTKNTSPITILNSFDINCTAVGYDIQNDKVYYLQSFVDFLESGRLLSINLNTPSHTAIRLAKKQMELNAKLDDKEFRIIQLCLDNMFRDIVRFRFTKKYYDLFQKYSELLNEYFYITDVPELENWLEVEKKVKKKIYKLNLVRDEQFRLYSSKISNLFFSENGNVMMTTEILLFYFRQIEDKPKLEDIYKKLFFFYESPDYVDNANEVMIDSVANFAKQNPRCINNLVGYKLVEQDYIIREVMTKITNKFCENTALKILEKRKFKPDIILDNDDILLLGLSVRKEVNYTQNVKDLFV